MSGKIKKERKQKKKNKICFLVSVLFSRQNKRFNYFKHRLVIYSLTAQNVVHGSIGILHDLDRNAEFGALVLNQNLNS